MGSLCMVLPGCNLTDYFCSLPVGEKEGCKITERNDQRRRVLHKRDIWWRCYNNSGARIPIIARVQSRAHDQCIFAKMSLGRFGADVMGVEQPRTPPCTSSASSAPRLGRARRNSL